MTSGFVGTFVYATILNLKSALFHFALTLSGEDIDRTMSNGGQKQLM